MTTTLASTLAFVLARPASSAAAPVSQNTTASPAQGATVHVAAPAENDRHAPRLWEERERVHATIAVLHGRVKHVPLSDALRAQLHALMRDEDADRYGRRVSTGALLLDVVDDVPAVVDAVLAGKVTGFGPGALRYTCELAVSLVGQWCDRVACTKERVEASSKRSVAVDDVHACTAALARRLDGVLPYGTPEREAMAAALKQRSRSDDEALAVVEALLPVVGKVFLRAAAEPGYRALLDDANFTEASIAALLLPVSEAVEARAAHRAARSAEAMTRQQLARIEGRLRGQLLRLRDCVEAERGKGAMLREMKLSRTRERRTKKATAPKGGVQGGGAQGGGASPVVPPT